MKTGFIYIWFDRKHKKYYIGSHLGTEYDGYVCSSRWMRQSYKRRPHDFKRRILQRNIEKRLLKEQEYQWLKLIKEDELGFRYYNLNNKKILKPGNWPEGTPRSEETKKRVSEGLKKAYEKGYTVWNKGLSLTEEQKRKISEDTKKGMSDLPKETKTKIKSTQFKKGHFTWNKGLKNWRTFSMEEKQMRSELAIIMHKEGKIGNKGRLWYTNGEINRMLFPSDEIPHGFYKGKTHNG